MNKNYDFKIKEEKQQQYQQQKYSYKENNRNINLQDNIFDSDCNNINIMDNSNYFLNDILLLDLFDNEYNQEISSPIKEDKQNSYTQQQQSYDYFDNYGVINSDDDLFPDEESFIITEQGISTQDYELHLQGDLDNLQSASDHNYCTSTSTAITLEPTTSVTASTSTDYLKFLTPESSQSPITTNINPMLSEVAFSSSLPVENDWIPVGLLHNNSGEINEMMNSDEKIRRENTPPISLLATDSSSKQSEEDEICKKITLKRKLSDENDPENEIENKKSKTYKNLKINLNATKLDLNESDSISTPDLCDFVLELENLREHPVSTFYFLE